MRKSREYLIGDKRVTLHITSLITSQNATAPKPMYGRTKSSEDGIEEIGRRLHPGDSAIVINQDEKLVKIQK